ncbi:MAG TPA: nuclease-related domain-containing protein [Thermosynechococcaceae cyanobacterium]
MSNRRAGQNVYDLARKRRFKAIVSFTAAAISVIIPFVLVNAFEQLLKSIARLNPAQPSHLQISPLLYGLFALVAIGLVINGAKLWQQADRADQGAKGEEDMARSLAPLEQNGWQIEYGMRLGKGLGDADIFCVSPGGQAFVVDVKSHRGEVVSDGQQLSRRMGKQTYPFEKDFLRQAMKQALQVKEQKRLNFVTPIVAFSQARVAVGSKKPRGVYVVEKAGLVALLRSLG